VKVPGALAISTHQASPGAIRAAVLGMRGHWSKLLRLYVPWKRNHLQSGVLRVGRAGRAGVARLVRDLRGGVDEAGR
jgi:hypothetical protein